MRRGRWDYRVRWALCMAAWAVLTGGCGSKQAAGTGNASGGAGTGPGPGGSEAAAKDVVEDTGRLNPKMLPAHKLKKEEIIVGGCRDACEDPKNAMRNFVRALFGTGPEGLPELKRFIDSTMLKDNGQALGEKWAGLWLDRKIEERRKSVDAWVEAYRKRCGTVASADKVEESLATTMSLQRLSSRAVKFEYTPPDRSGAGNAGTWTVVVGQRGLEWLVQEIYD